jgi:hypothetical protein
MIALIGDWGETFAAAAAESGTAGSEARFRATWRALFKLFETDRAVLLASYEIAAQAVRSPELKAIFVAAWRDVRSDLPQDFIDVEGLDAKTVRAVGGVLLALISGLTVQHLIDPAGTPGPGDLVLGIKTIAKAFGRAGAAS